MIAEKKFKHGDVNLENGLVFWSYDKACKNGERWVTEKQFKESRDRANARSKERYWSNIDQSRARLREQAQKHKDKRLVAHNVWKDKNKNKIRGNRLIKTYGLSNEDYISMFESQIGLCAICGEQQQGVTKDGEVPFLCVDHCHSTGKVRELLCVKCNTGLGQFRDNSEFLIKASKYLIKHQTKGMQQ